MGDGRGGCHCRIESLVRRGPDSRPLGGKGPRGALIGRHNWSSTRLGPLASWPEGRRTVFSVFLSSPGSMAILWGEEGLIRPTAAYAELAGGYSLPLLGRPVRDAWPELRGFHDRVLPKVRSSKALSHKDMELRLHRHAPPCRPSSTWTTRPSGAETASRLRSTPRWPRQRPSRAGARPAGAQIAGLDRRPADAPRVRRWRRPVHLRLGPGRRPVHRGRTLRPAREPRLGGLRQGTAAGRHDGLGSARGPARVAGGGGVRHRPGADCRHQCRVMGADCSLRWIAAAGWVELAYDRAPLCFTGVFLDFERRRAAETERPLRAFLDAVPGHAKPGTGRGGSSSSIVATRRTASAGPWPISYPTQRRHRHHGERPPHHGRWRHGADRGAIQLQRRNAGGLVLDQGAAARPWRRGGRPGGFLPRYQRAQGRRGRAGRMRSALPDHGGLRADHALGHGRLGHLHPSGPPWREFTGSTTREAMDDGRPVLEHPDDKSRTLRALSEASSLRPFRLEYRMRRADGAWRWVIDAPRPGRALEASSWAS